MIKLDTESKIDFDRSIGTEDRFNLRKWFGKLVGVLNQSNPQIWTEALAQDLDVTGFTDDQLDQSGFSSYLSSQFQEGEFVIRYPFLKARYKEGVFLLSGTVESFIDGVLVCSGDVELHIMKQDESFILKAQHINPRFRVQR